MISKLKNRINLEQYEPSLLGLFVNPFFIARKNLFKHIKELGKEITGKTLDVGCGTKPYEKLFISSEYVGLEIETTMNKELKKADFFYDGNTFPFADSEFDSIVCNQVLEHVFNPDDFLGEVNRVLKPGGKLLLTVPFVWDEHEQPYDYARYSSFGLKSLIEKNGFTLLKHIKSVKNYSVISQLTIAYFFKIVYKKRAIKIFFTLFLFPLITIGGLLLGKVLPDNDDLFLDNIILAEKVSNV